LKAAYKLSQNVRLDLNINTMTSIGHSKMTSMHRTMIISVS